MLLGAILLLLAAMLLVAAELFLPSHGILAVLAALFAIGSVILAYRTTPLLGLVFGLLVLFAAPVVLYYAIKIYPNTPMGKRIILANPTPASTDPFAAQSAKLQTLLGQTGTAVSFLRPAGTCEFNGQRIDCMAESDLIEPGTKIQAIRVTGLKVIVKPVA